MGVAPSRTLDALRGGLYALAGCLLALLALVLLGAPPEAFSALGIIGGASLATYGLGVGSHAARHWGARERSSYRGEGP